MGRLGRIALVLVLTLANAFVAFAASAAFSAAFLVAPDAGLAGPAEVIGYGLIAALVGAAVTLATAPRLSARSLGPVTLAAAVIASVLSLGLVLRYLGMETGPRVERAPSPPVAVETEPAAPDCGGTPRDDARGDEPECRK